MKLKIAHPEEDAPAYDDYSAIKAIREAPYRPQGFEYVEITLEGVETHGVEDDMLRIDFHGDDPPLRADANESWVVEAEDS